MERYAYPLCRSRQIRGSESRVTCMSSVQHSRLATHNSGLAQGDRRQHFVANVEVIVGVAGTPPSQDAVMGIIDREPRNGGAQRGFQFHALEDEIDAELMATFHPSQVRPDVVFLANSFFGPLH